MTPIHVMRATLTIKETSEKEPDFENKSQESMQSEEDEKEEAEKDEVSLSSREFSASEMQQNEEENLENITSINMSSQELLNHSSAVSTKVFYSGKNAYINIVVFVVVIIIKGVWEYYPVK